MPAEQSATTPSSEIRPVLRVIGLTTEFGLPDRTIRAVDELDLEVGEGETACIVGESGSGKTVTGLSILQLIPRPGRIVKGRIELDGKNLLDYPLGAMEEVRGSGVTMIFQDPKAALDPFFKIGPQLIETVRVRHRWPRARAVAEVREYLALVRVRSVDRVMDSYPHQLSGGECQRAMFAMALLCRPRLLIADEATSSLDAVVQAEILSLLKDLKRRFGMAVVFITHNFGVVASIADTVTVMYAGRVVEQGPVNEILASPQHPYTIGLINSVPRIAQRSSQLFQIEGTPPDMGNLPPGCRFAPRCREKIPVCERSEPPPATVGVDRLVRCFLRGQALTQCSIKPEPEVPGHG